MIRQPGALPARRRFSMQCARKRLRPLWELRAASDPGALAAPAIWRFDDVRGALLRAAELVTGGEAERRVLALENPALPGSACIGRTLFAGMQLLLPGELASLHRHTPSALRFVVEGEGAYTVLDGEKVPMNRGDLVPTPAWAWHAHGNAGSKPVIWLDGLDSPLVRHFGAYFLDKERAVVRRAAGRARKRIYGCAEMLGKLERSPLHPAHGCISRYADPETGADPIPTIAAFLRKLPAGFTGAVYVSTESAVFCVMTGRGSVTIGGRRLAFGPHDLFFVPPCNEYSLQATEPCVLFNYSDRAAQEALGYWRELT